VRSCEALLLLRFIAGISLISTLLVILLIYNYYLDLCMV
jgi:hypothetical protein